MLNGQQSSFTLEVAAAQTKMSKKLHSMQNTVFFDVPNQVKGSTVSYQRPTEQGIYSFTTLTV